MRGLKSKAKGKSHLPHTAVTLRIHATFSSASAHLPAQVAFLSTKSCFSGLLSRVSEMCSSSLKIFTLPLACLKGQKNYCPCRGIQNNTEGNNENKQLASLNSIIDAPQYNEICLYLNIILNPS